MSHSTVRLGNGELDAVAELHRVNLSPENRFEASPLRGNSTATGLSGVTLVCLCAMAAITPLVRSRRCWSRKSIRSISRLGLARFLKVLPQHLPQTIVP